MIAKTKIRGGVAACTALSVLVIAPLMAAPAVASDVAPLDPDDSAAEGPDPGSLRSLVETSGATGTHEKGYEFEEPGLEGTWYCHQVRVMGSTLPLIGDPEHIALCEQWVRDNVVCYIYWVKGTWNGSFVCLYY